MLFDQSDEDGMAILLVEEVTEEWRKHALEAANLCPALAITIVDEV